MRTLFRNSWLFVLVLFVVCLIYNGFDLRGALADYDAGMVAIRHVFYIGGGFAAAALLNGLMMKRWGRHRISLLLGGHEIKRQRRKQE